MKHQELLLNLQINISISRMLYAGIILIISESFTKFKQLQLKKNVKKFMFSYFFFNSFDIRDRLLSYLILDIRNGSCKDKVKQSYRKSASE